ncbi:hypothetical protein A1O7_05708, partial [Cladophialophora yegresii CBS 114405]
FREKQAAVLESIKFQGRLMAAFEQETRTSWFNSAEHDGEKSSLLPATQHIRTEAQALLQEFADHPLPDLTALLQPKENGTRVGPTL